MKRDDLGLLPLLYATTRCALQSALVFVLHRGEFRGSFANDPEARMSCNLELSEQCGSCGVTLNDTCVFFSFQVTMITKIGTPGVANLMETLSAERKDIMLIQATARFITDAWIGVMVDH